MLRLIVVPSSTRERGGPLCQMGQKSRRTFGIQTRTFSRLKGPVRFSYASCASSGTNGKENAIAHRFSLKLLRIAKVAFITKGADKKKNMCEWNGATPSTTFFYRFQKRVWIKLKDDHALGK